MLVTAAVIPHEVTDDGNPLNPYDDKYKNDWTILLGLPGALAMVGSIPLFIASGKNKRRAMNLSFKNEWVPQMGRSSFVYRTVPSLNLKINL